MHYIIHELLKLCTPKNSLAIGPDRAVEGCSGNNRSSRTFIGGQYKRARSIRAPVAEDMRAVTVTVIYNYKY